MRIAIADDEQILLAHMQKIVTELLPNDETEAFSSTAKLWEAAQQKPFDVVFLDVQMPGMTGIALAGLLKNQNDRLNVIFVTGYDGYQAEAMEMFASGYVKKPVTKEKIQKQLENLRYPVVNPKVRLFAQTFGNFTLFADGKPVAFARAKSQAMLAYLIQRRGSFVSKKELSIAVFEDEVYDANRTSYMSKLCADIQGTMAKLGVADLLKTSSNGLSVDTTAFTCDLYDFLDGKPGAGLKYTGRYMSQYAFGEEMMMTLDELKAAELSR